jgi:hypothetical protein
MARAKLKLAQHSHSGKVCSHEHTSYGPLAILLLVMGCILAVYTVEAESPGPQAGSVGLVGVVPGKPPTSAATIKTPTDGQRFISTPIAVSGSCPKNTLVEVFKNDIFAGSSVCTDTGSFSFDIDLMIGPNALTARVYDALNQPGPDSNTVTVYYDALPDQSGPVSFYDFAGAQLLLNTDAVIRGVFPDKEFSIPIDIIGGKPPYAVSIMWGDTNSTVLLRNDNSSFRSVHTYKKSGVHQISIQAKDSENRVAFLTVAAIVNGQPDPTATATTDNATTNRLLTLWPLYTAAVAVVISFWLGEKREKRVLAARGLLLASN